MTPEQIEQWAWESGFKQGPQPCETPLMALIRNSEFHRLTRFAELVAQAERERCALVAKNYPRADEWIAEEIAAAIRNSKQG